MTIVIGCGSLKGTEPMPAKDLYQGNVFTIARAAAERDGRPWLIISARYGLLDPDTVIEPYDQRVRTKADARRLATLIAMQANRPLAVEAWCAGLYADAMRQAGILVSEPLANLRIGHRKHFFKEHAA